MSLRSRAARRPFGMAAVAAVGAAALVLTAGVVLWPSADETVAADAHGVLADYENEPTPQWTIDHESMPGIAGNGAITIEGSSRGDWLLSYSAGIRHAYLLVDGDTGRPRWDRPVDAGFGACAFNRSGTLGCSIKTRTDGPENGFYLVDRGSGETQRRSEGADTKTLIGLGDDFVHVNDTGYQVSRRTESGDVVWRRTFAATATPVYSDGVLRVETTDGGRFVLDPRTGDDVLACQSCAVAVYPKGVVVERGGADQSLAFHPIVGGAVAERAAKTVDGLRLLSGPSTRPVATASNDQTFDTHGRYQVFDPATGEATWEVADSELSKVHTRPCGPLIAVARKDRSRVFFALADGARLGELPPPSFEDPDSNLDLLRCVGASDQTAVFASNDQITAYRPATGRQVWSVPLGVAAVVKNVDGRIAVREGSTVTVYRPN